ncbi:cullin-like protein [Leptomonas pyrrhocoris]|uniref:Cullin-like protein n=1 Tax=Leptomonas pyrrhocoris TaxID=157538 RepID=A0A0N0DWA3_LEPPY|nr:cullin-like protein [Leptomonas pyrrhocoris]KPA81281.1 cullin-like protein [Leptomonas pyrrhocoris]|eukprot:XP_015659720.1 cullin-like protein [Leptomonas pyrrhocoris]
MAMSSAISSRKRVADRSCFPEKWAIVEESVRCIFRKEICSHSFQRIHHSVFQICQAQCGTLILEQLNEQFRLQVGTVLQRINASDNFAADFLRMWQDYNDSVNQISNILLYFDKNYMYAYHHSSIEQTGERIFCTQTLSDPEVSARLIASVKQSVENPAAEVFIRDLGQELYTAEGGKYFACCMEFPFVEAKIEKYYLLGEEQKQLLDPCQYLQWVQNVVYTERDRYTDTFFYIVLDKLTNALYTSLVLNDPAYVRQVLLGRTGLERLTSTWEIGSIAIFVQVFCAMRREKDVVDVIANAVKECGERIVGDRSANTFPFSAVDDMLQLIAKAKELDSLFPAEEGHSHAPFLRVVRNVLGSNTRFMEVLSLYYDAAIRQNKDETMESVGNNVLTILQLTPDLEPFEVAFRGHLAARLIHAKPHAIDMECFFIDCLSNIYGSSVVNRFQKMVEDIRSAITAQQKMVAEMAMRKNSPPIEFDVLVLTSGLWPQYTNIPLHVPESMETCKSIFYEYYRRRHNGRKLVFQMSLGSVVFQLHHAGKTYSVSAHTHFVNSILALNSNEGTSVAAVAQKSALGRDEVLAQFNTLCNTSLAVRNGNDFCFNMKFYSPKPKVKVGASVQKNSGDGIGASTVLRKAVERTRTMSIDAIIVKLLKEHQSVSHENLCSAIEDDLRDVYSPTRSEIKHRIEALIEKGFIVRGESANCYFYCT